MSKFIIKSHRPWQMAVAIIALSMVISIFTWLLLDTNHWEVIYHQLSGNITTKDLLGSNQKYRDENSQLKDKIIMLEQTTQLDKDTAIHMQNALMSLQDEIYKQKRELEFYQGVMDATRGASGLDIHGIYVEPLTKPNQYVIKLVLTNVTLSDRLLEGSLDIQIDGMQNKNKHNLDISTILLDENASLTFELKSFRRVEYEIELPTEYLPHRILVKVHVGNAREQPISKIYDWPLI
ncbi:MAG: DUF6776 family protein [Gammaproteobacteria bacterium]|jgi:hypothetical protein